MATRSGWLTVGVLRRVRRVADLDRVAGILGPFQPAAVVDGDPRPAVVGQRGCRTIDALPARRSQLLLHPFSTTLVCMGCERNPATGHRGARVAEALAGFSANSDTAVSAGYVDPATPPRRGWVV